MSLPILTLYKLHYIAYNPIFIIFKTPRPQNLQNISFLWQESHSASSGGKRIRWFRVVKKLVSNWEMNSLSYPRLSKQQKRSFSDLSKVTCGLLIFGSGRYYTISHFSCPRPNVYGDLQGLWFFNSFIFRSNLILTFQQTLRKLYLNLPIQDSRSQQSLSCSPRGSNYHHLSTMFSTETRSFSPLKARWCPYDSWFGSPKPNSLNIPTSSQGKLS